MLQIKKCLEATSVYDYRSRINRFLSMNLSSREIGRETSSRKQRDTVHASMVINLIQMMESVKLNTQFGKQVLKLQYG